MSKILVLAEKPSVGREIARVLGCNRPANGHIIGDKYIVTWALGHLVTLAEPEKYGEKYKTWSIESLPMLPERMELNVIPQTAKQYSVVKNLLHSNEVSSLVIATDAGREGELVARWIINKAGVNKPIKRLWISSQTDKAIREGFNKLRDGKEYMNLYHSAVCRAEADWLVGLNVTRALTCKHNAQLSAGRVQTPTLKIIVDREKEIRSFRPADYYNINVDLGSFTATYHDKKGTSAVYDKAEAEMISDKIKNKTLKVYDVKITDKRTPPPALYDLTELQRDANKLYGYSAKQTLNLMQTLYETHKALTYPRTDSRYLTDDIVSTLPDRMKAISFGDFMPLVTECRNKPINRSCINNGKVSDHHAIIPTEQRVNISLMSAEEKRIYFLVVKRFLANFYPDYLYKQVKIELVTDDMNFSSSGREVINQGWKKINSASDDDGDDNDQTLPQIKKGDSFICKNVQLKALKTTPPPRYTEASLLSAMENPSKFITDVKMREYIGGGLGTPATRADIIEKLFSSFYIEKQGNNLLPTSKAFQLIDIVPDDLKEPLLTASWEMKLDAIKNGKADKNVFISDIRQYTTSLVKTVVNSDAQYKHDNITREVCPECGKLLLRVNGKKGTMLVCQDRDCKYRKSLTLKTNVRCPTCHKVMEIFGEDDKRTYSCVCGFRERVNKFHESRKESGVSKSEVQKYLQNQNKEEEYESPFALALKKAMEEKFEPK